MTTQYFELATNRAIYHDGWIACSRYGLPWETAGRGDGFVSTPWELSNLEDDFSEAVDLAREQPDKLAELQGLFLEEAKKYDVFPLDPRFSERFDPTLRIAGAPGQAGPTSATTCGCPSRSAPSSSRDPTA